MVVKIVPNDNGNPQANSRMLSCISPTACSTV